MTDYRAPVAEMEFVLNELADLPGVATLPGFEEASPDLVHAVLEEGGKLAGEVLAPLNQSGDQQTARLDNGSSRVDVGRLVVGSTAFEENTGQMYQTRDSVEQCGQRVRLIVANDLWRDCVAAR